MSTPGITLGMDSHTVDDLAAGYDHARSLLKGALKSTVYINRTADQEDELFG